MSRKGIIMEIDGGHKINLFKILRKILEFDRSYINKLTTKQEGNRNGFRLELANKLKLTIRRSRTCIYRKQRVHRGLARTLEPLPSSLMTIGDRHIVYSCFRPLPGTELMKSK